jgi:hypothetical protein
MRTIILTDKIRALPYFSDFQENQVDVPDKPFLQELLDEELCFEDLSLEELFACVETCVYFNLDSFDITEEILWKIGAKLDLLNRFFIKRKEVRYFTNRFPPLVKKQMIRECGQGFSREIMVQMGIRCLNPSYEEILKANHLRLLKWRHASSGKPLLDKNLSKLASAGWETECLQYLHENGCPWDEGACNYAAENGQLNHLKYLYENGCPWDESTCCSAAFGGRLHCLKYAREHGCPWDERVVTASAYYLDCLKYVYEQGMPLSLPVIDRAAVCGRLECLKYLHEHGCPWDEQTYDNAVRGGNPECLKYLEEQDCPR